MGSGPVMADSTYRWLTVSGEAPQIEAVSGLVRPVPSASAQPEPCGWWAITSQQLKRTVGIAVVALAAAGWLAVTSPALPAAAAEPAAAPAGVDASQAEALVPEPVSDSQVALALPASMAPPVAALSESAPLAGTEYVVQPGDTLSLIAGRALGDINAWPALFAQNQGIARLPDGRTLTNPPSDLAWPAPFLARTAARNGTCDAGGHV